MVTFMIFLGMANAYIMRTNMSVAIVAMVNHTAIKSNDEVIEIEDKCGELTNETNAAEGVSIQNFSFFFSFKRLREFM